MITHEVTIHLDKPVEQVFAFLMDTTQLTTWQTNLIKIDKITEGPLRMSHRQLFPSARGWRNAS